MKNYKNYKITDPPIDFFDDYSPTPFFSHIISCGDEYSYHVHKFCEIVYIVSGEINHVVNEEFQELKYLDIFFLRPSDRQALTE